MNIKFESIDIENFRSIKDAHIKLSNQGIVIVKGINEYEDKATSNGSGKSSIFEAIVFALFDETSSGEKDVANRIINNGYYINLIFYIDKDKYQILRQCKSNKTSVILYKNDIDISARNKTDTNKLIVSILGINKSIFLDSIFLSQSANTNLASLSPTARKERLEILTNTDAIITAFKEQLKNKQVFYESECVKSQMQISKYNGNIEAIEKQKLDIQQKIDEIQKQIEQLKSLGNLKDIDIEIDNLQKQIVDMDNLISQSVDDIADKEQEINNIRQLGESDLINKDELENKRQQKLNEYNDVTSKIDKLNTEIQYKQQTQDRLNKEIEQIKNSDKCPTCGRKYENANEQHIMTIVNEKTNLWNDEQTQINNINENIKILNNDLTNIVEQGQAINNQITIVQESINKNKLQINEKDLERITLVSHQQQLYANKKQIQQQINSLQDKKEQILKTEISSIDNYEQMLKDLDEQTNIIQQQIHHEQEQYDVNDSYVNVTKNAIQLVTKEFRTYLLQTSLQYLNKVLATLSSQLFSNEQDVIAIEEDDAKLNIKLGNGTYESLSGGEKTRVNIALLLAQKSLAEILGNISCNIIILDEILGYCDSQAEGNVIDLVIQELETLESIYMVSHKEIPLGYDTQLTIIKDKTGLSRVSSI